MVTYELQAEEVILYEGIVTCKLYKGRVKLILTSQKIVFEREKGIVKKNREIIDTIPLNSIKFYNDIAQIKPKGAEVDVQTTQKNLAIVFPGVIEARKFTGKAIDAVTGTTGARRSSNIIKEAFTVVDDTLGLDTRKTVKSVLENGLKDTIWNGIGKKNR